MQKHKLLVIPVLVLVAISGFLAGQYQTTQSNDQLENTMHVELYLYKNGKLVYYDPDDPAVSNMIKAIAEIISPPSVGGIKDVDGGTFNGLNTYTGLSGQLFITNATGLTFNRDTYVLPTPNILLSVNLEVTDNVITVSASHTFTSDYDITAVGLVSHSAHSGSNPDYLDEKQVLLFYDVLDTPVHVENGTTVTIIYKIVVP